MGRALSDAGQRQPDSRGLRGKFCHQSNAQFDRLPQKRGFDELEGVVEAVNSKNVVARKRDHRNTSLAEAGVVAGHEG